MEKINFQSELNIHQFKFLDNILFDNIKMPFLNYSFDISINVFMYTTILLIIGFGSYIKFFSKFNLIFWEREYSIYSTIFILNIFIGSILSNLNLLTYSWLIEPELVELFIYLIFVLDTHSKINNVRLIK